MASPDIGSHLVEVTCVGNTDYLGCGSISFIAVGGVRGTTTNQVDAANTTCTIACQTGDWLIDACNGNPITSHGADQTEYFTCHAGYREGTYKGPVLTGNIDMYHAVDVVSAFAHACLAIYPVTGSSSHSSSSHSSSSHSSSSHSSSSHSSSSHSSSSHSSSHSSSSHSSSSHSSSSHSSSSHSSSSRSSSHSSSSHSSSSHSSSSHSSSHSSSSHSSSSHSSSSQSSSHSSSLYSSSHSSSSHSSSSHSSSHSSSSHSSSSRSSVSSSHSSSASSVASTVRFGDNTTYTMTYPGTQDCDLIQSQLTYNSGTSYYLIVGSYIIPTVNRGLIAFDLKQFNSDHPYAVITSATLKFYVAAKV
jgi:hypothetical protein